MQIKQNEFHLASLQQKQNSIATFQHTHYRQKQSFWEHGSDTMHPNAQTPTNGSTGHGWFGTNCGLNFADSIFHSTPKDNSSILQSWHLSATVQRHEDSHKENFGECKFLSTIAFSVYYKYREEKCMTTSSLWWIYGARLEYHRWLWKLGADSCAGWDMWPACRMTDWKNNLCGFGSTPANNLIKVDVAQLKAHWIPTGPYGPNYRTCEKLSTSKKLGGPESGSGVRQWTMESNGRQI